MGPPWVQQRKTRLKTGANPIHLHLAKRRRIAPFCVHVIPADPPGADLYCFSPALSQARRGPTHPVTVMFYTPRGRAAIRNPWP